MATTRTNITVSALLTAATVWTGLTIAVPATSAPPAPVASVGAVSEDDPGWDCYTMGNGVCGDPDGKYAADAWDAWDRTQGWRHLRTTTDATRVEYVGDAHHPIVVGEGQVAIPGKGKEWYLFRAVSGEPTIGYRTEAGE